MPKKPIVRRARKRVEVHYGPDEPRYLGYSGNLSKTGIMVRAMKVFAPGTILNLEIRFPSKVFRIQGAVVWARAGSLEWLNRGRVGMGITFIKPPEEFLSAV